MAFNPFHKFRKHQKAIFAGLTILCMVIFVLGPSGGALMQGGDFFSNFSRWVTGKARQTDIATINGKGISAADLQEVARKRKLANQFMQTAMFMVMINSPEAADREHPASMRQLQEALGAIERRSGGAVFFGGKANFPAVELLDFLVWKNEADRMGISLSDRDVGKEVTRLTLDRFNNKLADDVYKMLRQQPGGGPWNPELVMDALRDEFRVRMAKEVLGYEAGGYQTTKGNVGQPVSPVAAAFTPQEFWTFFEDNCKKIEVGLIPVKVDDFVAKVTESPTDKDIKELYGKFRDKVYNADAPTPAFKLPRRAQVEWVSALTDTPVFKKLAKETAQVERVRRALGAVFGDIATGAGPIAAGVDFYPLAFDLPVIGEYEQKKGLYYEAASWVRPWGNWDVHYPVHASSRKDAAAVAGAVGQGFGLVGSSAVPFGVLGSVEARVTANEITGRLGFGTTMLLTGTAPSGLAVAAMAMAGTPTEPYLPYAEVKGYLQDYLNDINQRQARNTVLDIISKEIGRIGKAKDQPMLDAYIAQVIKEYGLKSGKSKPLSTEYTNRFDLAADDSLKLLKDTFVPPSFHRGTPDEAFTESLLGTAPGTYDVQHWPNDPGNPNRWQGSEPAYLVWRNADEKEATVPLDDPKLGQQVRAEVERAWRFDKARALAKKEAERLLEEARKEKGDKQGLRDFSQRLVKVPLIELPPMGRLNRTPSLIPGRGSEYSPPRIPENKVAHAGELPKFPFGPQEPSRFATKVVELRSKTLGDGTVIPDQPEGIYYVAVLLSTQPPSEIEFYEAYRDSATKAVTPNILFSQGFEPDQRQKFRNDLMERLRKSARLEVVQENLKRYGGSTPDSSEE